MLSESRRTSPLIRRLLAFAAGAFISSGLARAELLFDSAFGPISIRPYSAYGVIPVFYSGMGLFDKWSDLGNWALLNGPTIRPDPLPGMKLFNEININLDGAARTNLYLDAFTVLSVVDNAWAGIKFEGQRSVLITGESIYQTDYEGHIIPGSQGKPYQVYLWQNGMKNFTPQDVLLRNIDVFVDASQEWVVSGGGFDLDTTVFLQNHTLSIAGDKQVRIGNLNGAGTITWSQSVGTLQINSATNFTGTIDTTFSATPATVFLNGGSSSAFNGRIVGTGRVVVNGGFTLGGTLANTFTGTLESTGGTLALARSTPDGAFTGSSLKVTSGTLRLDASHQIANTVPVILDHSTFQVGGFLDTIGSLDLTRSSVTGTGRLTLQNTSIISRANSQESTISAEIGLFGLTLIDVAGQGPSNDGGLHISGAIVGGSILKRGTGALTLSGNNTFSQITAEAGTVIMAHNAAFGIQGTELFAFNGGTLKLGAGFNTLSPGRVFIVDSGGGTLDTNGTNLNLGTPLGGTGAFVKTGAGTLSLPASNSISAFDLREGTLQIRGNGGGGPHAQLGAFTLTKGALQASGTTIYTSTTSWHMAPGESHPVTGANLNVIDTNGATVTMPGAISGSGGLTVIGGGALALSGTNTYTGVTRVDAATLRISGSTSLGGGSSLLLDNGGMLALDGSATFGGQIEVLNATAIIDTNTNNFTANGNLLGTTRLEKRGAGELRLNGTKTFGGEFHVTGGVLALETGLSAGNATRIMLDGGSLRLLNALSLAVPVDGFAAGSVIDTGANNVTFTAPVGGTLVKQGTGTLTLVGPGNNTFATLTVAAGMVEFSTAPSLAGNITLDGGGLKWAAGNTADISSRLLFINAGGGTLDTGANNVTFAHGYDWTGAVMKTGAGRLTISVNNRFLGGIVVQSGTVAFNQAQERVMEQVISGAGAVEHLGASALTLSGANSFTGGLTVSGGGDVIILDGGAPGAGAVNLQNGRLVFNQGLDFIFNGAISGAGSLVKNGAGALTLSGANTFTGGVSVNDGTLAAAHATALGNGGNIALDAATLRADATLTLASSRNVSLINSSVIETSSGVVLTLNGIVSGGAWVKNGAGTLVLGNANTFTGLLTVNGGTLAAAHAGALGSSTGLVLNAATLRTDTTLATAAGYGVDLQNGAALEAASGATLTLAGVLSGGPLVKNGAGTVVLTNTNTFTGGIVVNGGTLTGKLAALPGNVSGAGGTLRIDEGVSAGWNVQVSGGVSLEFFNSTTPFGVINLDAATRFTHTGATQVSSGVLLNLNAANTLSAGSALIVNGQLDLAGSSQTVASLAGSGLIYSFNANPVTATLVTNVNNASTTFSGVLADNTGFGAGKLALWKAGFGTLTLSGANTFTGGVITSGNGVLYGTHASAFGTAGAITLSSGTLRTGVTMSLAAAHDLIVTGAGGTLNVDAGTRLTVDGVISGGALLTKSGTGTLVLTNANTFNGGTHLTAGLIEFSTLANLGAGNLTLNGGGLRWTSGSTIDVSSRLNPFGAGSGIFDTNGNNITLATALTGGGGLIKDGAGTLTLAADPTYTGTTVVVAGKLIVNGSPDGPIAVGSGAEIEINGDATSLGLGGDGTMRLGTGNLTLNVPEGVFTSFNGTLVTTGGVIKNGLGTQAFAGPNTFTGGLTINAGVLQANGDAGLGASNGFVKFNGGTLRWGLLFNIGSTREITLLAGGGGFDVSTYTTTLSQGISGSGALTKLGIGILSLQGTNTFTGGIHLNNGILVGHAASLPGNIAVQTGTILHLDQNTDAAWNANLSGGGSIELMNQSGFGVLRMTAGNAHTNTGTTLVGPNLYLVAPTANGTNAFSAASAYTVNGVLDLSGFTQTIGSLAGSGQVYSYSLSAARGTLIVGGNGTNSTFSGVIQDNTGSLGDTGTLAVVKQGAGVFSLRGSNTFTGGLTVNEGLASFATAANLGASTGRITLNGGGLRWDGPNGYDVSPRLEPIGPNGGTIDVTDNHLTFSQPVSGSGTLIQRGAGSLTLPTLQGFSGGFDVQSTLNVGGSGDYTYSGGINSIYGAILNLSGSGMLTLTGTHSFVGGLHIGENVEVRGAVANIPGTAITLRGTLALTQSTDATFTAAIIGTGGGLGNLIKTGAGDVTFTQQLRHSGTTQVFGGYLVLTQSEQIFASYIHLDGGGLRWDTGGSATQHFPVGNTPIGPGGAFFDTNGNNVVLTGQLVGSGGVTKYGAGALTIPLISGYNGATTVHAGTLIASTSALYSTSSISISAGSTLQLDQAGVNSSDTLFRDTTGAGNVVVTNSDAPLGILRLVNGVKFTHTGSTTIAANTALVIAASSGVNSVSTVSPLTVNGILDLGGSDQTVASLDGSGQIYSASSTATLTINGAGTYSGIFKDSVVGLTGTLAVKKTGAGTLTLTGSSTHSGGVTVSSDRIDFSNSAAFGVGTLTLDGGSVRWTGAGNVTLANALSLSGTGGAIDTGAGQVTLTSVSSGSGALVKTGAGSLILAGLAHNGGTSITQGTLSISGSSSYSGIISGGGSLAKSGTGTLTLSGNNTFTGGVALTSGLIEFSAGSLGNEGAITFDGGGLKWVAGNTSDVSGRFAALGLNGAIFDTNGNDVTLATALTGGSVTKTGAGTLTLTDLHLRTSNTVITAGTLEARNTANAAYTGLISGAGTFLKSGGGTLVLGNGHTIGTTIIKGGLIEFSGTLADTLGVGVITLDGGGLKWAAGSTDDVSSRISPLGGGGGVFDTNGNNIIFNSSINGSGALSKQGAGNLAFNSPDSSFSGGLIVRQGLVIFSTLGNLGSGNITLDGGGLRWQPGNLSDASSRLNALGAGGGTFDTGTSNITFATAITGAGALIKQGSGTLTLTGISHTGGTTVHEGFLAFSNTAALGTSNITLDGGGLRWAAGSSLNHAAQVQLGVNGGTLDTGTDNVTFTTIVSGTGNLVKLGAGSLKLASIAHIGGTFINAGSIELATAAGGSYAGVISGAALIKSGAGTLTLTGASTFTGGLTVKGGFVEFTSGDNLGVSGITLDGGGLRWAAGSTLDISSRLNALGAGGGIIDTGANNVAFASGISGGTLTKQGSGTLNLMGGNSFSSLIVRQGIVEFAGHGSLSTGGITLDGGGLRWVTGNDANISARIAPIGANGAILDTGVNNISFDTTLTGTGILAKTGGGKLTLNGIAHTGGTHVAEGTLEAHVTTSASTRLTGSGIFVKNGSGALTLEAGSYHTGVTTVTLGSLIVNGYNLATTTVQNGATLGGSGVLGYVTLQNGATLAPGNSLGTLTLASDADGSFDFQSGSIVQMEITLGGPSDLLNFIGNGNSTLSFLSSLTITANTLLPTQMQTFNLLDWSGLTSAPTFASHFGQNLYRDGSQDNGSAWDLPDLSGTGFTWDLSQFTTNGIIQVVPEPGRALLLILGLSLILGRRRRGR